MDCHFTEEVSLLVDGELAPHEAARLGAHIDGCAACRQARASFLLLRQELRAYERAPDSHAQSRALAAILNSHTSAVETASSSTRGAGRRFSERLAEAFSLIRLRPAHVVTLALLLIVTALGLRWLMGSHTNSRAPESVAPAVADANSRPVQEATASNDNGTRSENPNPVNSPTVTHAKTPKPHRPALVASNSNVGREEVRGRRGNSQTEAQRQASLSRDQRQALARVYKPDIFPSSASAVALYEAASVRAAADPGLRVGRHAERVERLLRSFRNARLTEREPTLDVADARRLSKRLLYSNIALRREAATAGDLSVEGLLDSVEPILIDISNLPNTPSPDAVGSIKERIRRRHLVGALQAQVVAASR